LEPLFPRIVRITPEWTDRAAPPCMHQYLAINPHAKNLQIVAK